MKKIFAIASIALALGLGLAACDGKQSKEDAAMAQAKADSLAEVARQDSIAAGTFTIDENGIIVLMSQINEETAATPFIRMQKDEEGNLIVVNADGTLPEDVKAYTLVKKSEVAETME